MVIGSIKVGMKFGNYRQVCAALKEPIKSGSSKRSQIKRWKRYFNYEKIGNGFLIKEIYEDPIPKPRRLGSRRKDFPGFVIPYEKENSIGVYKITLGADIYVGSTTVGFRARYRQHRTDDTIQASHFMVNNGGEFDALEYMDGCSEEEIRKREEYYIKLYRHKNAYNVVNIIDEIPLYLTNKSHKKKYKYTTAYIPENYIDIVLSFAEQQGFLDEIKIKKVRGAESYKH